MYEVCIRKPEISSFMSRIVSRSRKQYMSIDIAPSSRPLVPIHTRCDERRVSSDMITRSDLRPRRHLDAHQLLDRQRVGEVVDGRRQVVVAVGDDHALLPAQRLHLLLDSRVQVADHRLDAADLLAVEVDDEPQHAVRRGMMRAEVDGEDLAAEGARLARSW